MAETDKANTPATRADLAGVVKLIQAELASVKATLATLTTNSGASSGVSNAAQPDPALAEIKEGMERIWARLGEVNASQPHPAGYCGEQDCEICVPQLRQAAQVVASQAKAELAGQVDSALDALDPTGELKAKYTEVVAKGMIAKANRDTPITVTA